MQKSPIHHKCVVMKGSLLNAVAQICFYAHSSKLAENHGYGIVNAKLSHCHRGLTGTPYL